MPGPIRTTDEGSTEMENDENRDPQQDDMEGAEDLEVSGDEAEGVAGGARKIGSDPDAGAQRL
jgi:hypothetical protein